MTSQELAEAVEDVVARAQSRVTGIGAEQYSQGTTQKFETMTLEGLVDYAIEETLDLVNYGVMLTIRLDRLRTALESEAPLGSLNSHWVPGETTEVLREKARKVADAVGH